MPQLIDHIDKIAREKGRDVLYIIFDRKIFDNYEWDEWPIRKETIKWFEENNIKTIECMGVASENGFESYRGQLYIDVLYDENVPEYIKVRDYLENKDGSMRIPGVLFCYLPLEHALRNKHHDEPGFWEGLSENTI